MSRGRLAAALAIGAAVSLVANGAKLAFTDYAPEADEWLAYAVIAGFPFAVLSFFKKADSTAWIVGLALTAALWAAYLLVGIPQLSSGGGVDMGLGLAVALSPLWITAACLSARALAATGAARTDAAIRNR